uniref:Uncharacterized protein n=1 Tax=Anguilla anguilla TaxID=7936 RepID=A0A0E9ST85_ANGAN
MSLVSLRDSLVSLKLKPLVDPNE